MDDSPVNYREVEPTMKTATGLTVVAVGAILAFAVTGSPSFFNIQIAGWVIMMAGVAGMILSRRDYGWLRRIEVRRPRGTVGESNGGPPALPTGQVLHRVPGPHTPLPDEIAARELVAAANKMHASLTLYETDQRLGRRDSDGSLVQCAITGCSLLRNVAYMQALIDDAKTLDERAADDRESLQAITAVDHFEFFLGVEGRLLDAAGADPSLTAVILHQCREAREAARRGEFNGYRFRRALEELRDEVCSVLTELRAITFLPAPPRPQYPRLVACFKGVCGCVIVGLDASSLAPTIGLTAAGSAVSIAVGAAIVDHALADLRSANAQNQPPPMLA